MTGFSEMKTGWRRKSDASMADDFSGMIGSVTLSNAKGLLFGASWGAEILRFALRGSGQAQNDNRGLE